MSDLIPCVGCGRMIGDYREQCPFCGAAMGVEEPAASAPLPPRDGDSGAVCLGPAVHLGGHAGCEPQFPGRLWISSEWIGLEEASNLPLRAAVPLADVESVTVEAGEDAESKGAAFLAAGVIGLLARSSRTAAVVAVTTMDGSMPTFVAHSMTAPEVRARIAPVLRAAAVTLK
jgi:hypothetical protein